VLSADNALCGFAVTTVPFPLGRALSVCVHPSPKPTPAWLLVTLHTVSLFLCCTKALVRDSSLCQAAGVTPAFLMSTALLPVVEPQGPRDLSTHPQPLPPQSHKAPNRTMTSPKLCPHSQQTAPPSTGPGAPPFLHPTSQLSASDNLTSCTKCYHIHPITQPLCF
jgi:hypothetical protein